MGLTKEVDKEYDVPAPAPWVIPAPDRSEPEPETKPVIVEPAKQPELVPA